MFEYGEELDVIGLVEGAWMSLVGLYISVGQIIVWAIVGPRLLNDLPYIIHAYHNRRKRLSTQMPGSWLGGIDSNAARIPPPRRSFPTATTGRVFERVHRLEAH